MSWWWLIFIWPRPASCSYLCPFISGYGKYIGQGGRRGRVLAHGPLCEYLCNKLICSAGSAWSSQRKAVWKVSFLRVGQSSAEANVQTSAVAWHPETSFNQSLQSRLPGEAWCWAVQSSYLSEYCQPCSHAFLALSSLARSEAQPEPKLWLTAHFVLLPGHAEQHSVKRKTWTGEFGDLVFIPYASTN